MKVLEKWMNKFLSILFLFLFMYKRKDKFYHKAKEEGYRARSAYKLIEINKKYNLIKKDSDVLDIGCAPGGWLQVVKKISTGRVVGVDIVAIEKIEGVEFILGDIKSVKIEGKFDVVLSDIAPKTSGQRERDQYISFELSKMSLEVARKVLKKGGSFLVKTFQSEETNDLVKEMKKYFEFVKRVSPKSSREGSKEVYLVGLGFSL